MNLAQIPENIQKPQLSVPKVCITCKNGIAVTTEGECIACDLLLLTS